MRVGAACIKLYMLLKKYIPLFLFGFFFEKKTYLFMCTCIYTSCFWNLQVYYELLMGAGSYDLKSMEGRISQKGKRTTKSIRIMFSLQQPITNQANA